MLQNLRPLAWVLGSGRQRTTPPARFCGSKVRRSILALPEPSWETSRMSFITFTNQSEDDLNMSMHSCCSALSSESVSKFTMPRMPLIGVRISWLMFAKNWLFSSATSDAFARAKDSSWFLRTNASWAASRALVRARTVSSSRCDSGLVNKGSGSPVNVELGVRLPSRRKVCSRNRSLQIAEPVASPPV